VGIRRDRLKQALVNGFDGCCNRCNYKDCLACLDFHHIDPSTKEFSVGAALTAGRPWRALAKEAAKCVLLCCICHKELHHKLWGLDEIKIVVFDEEKASRSESLEDCPLCGKKVLTGKRFCSVLCRTSDRRKIPWPPTKEIE
jgi:hypothetical protein